MSKKGAESITEFLPYIAITILIAIIVIILVFTFYKGGIAFLTNPPTTKLPT